MNQSFKQQLVKTLSAMQDTIESINHRLDKIEDSVEDYSYKIRGAEELQNISRELRLLGTFVYGEGDDDDEVN